MTAKTLAAGTPSDLFPQSFLQEFTSLSSPTPWSWDSRTTVGGNTSASISGGICTLTTTSAHNLLPGMSFYLTGLTPGTSGSLTGYQTAITASGTSITFATAALGTVTGTGAVSIPDVRLALLNGTMGSSSGSGTVAQADYQNGSGYYGVGTGTTNNNPTGGVGGTGAGTFLLNASTPEIAAGGGGSGYYNPGGKALTTCTVTNSPASYLGQLTFGADNAAWPPTGTTPDGTNYATMTSVWGGLIYVFNSTAKLALGLVNFGQAYVVSGGQLTVVWNPTGYVFTLNLTPNP